MNSPTHPILIFFGRTPHLAVLLCGLNLIGCGNREASSPGIDAKVSIQFEPNPPIVGKNNLEVTLTDPSGKSIQLGMIKVEGNMNHAGMKPVFAELMENDPGKYAGSIELTMGGDWFLLLSSEPSPEGQLNAKVDVPGVKAK